MTIRILVVDDSVVIRKLLTATLNEAPGMQVVATAALGKIALAKISQCNPDIVILDVEMPEMDGIETLRRIRKEAPLLPVIMFSTKTDRGAAATIEALTCGASDYVTKPSNAGNVLNAMARVREEMVPKIQALAGRARPTLIRPATSPFAIPLIRTTTSPLATSSVKTTTVQPFATTRITTMSGSATLPIATLLAATPPMVKPTTQVSSRARPTTAAPIAARDGTVRMRRPTGGRPPVAIVAIGASTGGPNALSVLLAQLPADFPVPIVIVQHMLATFTQHFADRLASQCRIKIIEATAGDALEAGHAYIARGDHHLLVERRMGRAGLAMNQDAVENFCRPAVDVLFRSVAQIYGTSALAVVLTGMGHDGLLGCGAIRESGGDVIVQDEASSVVWGMPGFVARAGLASQVLPLDQLGSEIQRRVAFGIARAVGATP